MSDDQAWPEWRAERIEAIARALHDARRARQQDRLPMKLWRAIHRRLRPHRYWTRAELDAAHERAARLAQELDWK